MAFCIRCGAQLQEGAGFCNNCGAAQVGGGQAVPQMQPQGGMQYQQSQMQPQSGMQYQQPQMQSQYQAEQQMQQAAQQSKKGRTGLIIGLVCGGVALTAGIVVLILFLTGVIGGGGVKDIAATTNTAVTGDTGTEEEYPDALVVGTDIPLEEITSVSFADGNSMARFGEGYSISQEGDSIKYIAYESHMEYDAEGEEEVRTERETDLTAEEWDEMLSLLEGVLFYRFPYDVLDGYTYYRMEWETKPSDGIYRDSFHFPDETKRKAFADFRQKLAARADVTGPAAQGEMVEITGYYGLGISVPEEDAEKISYDAYAAEGGADLTQLAIHHRDSLEILCILVIRGEDETDDELRHLIRSGIPFEALGRLEREGDGDAIVYRIMYSSGDEARPDDQYRPEYERLLEEIRSLTEPDKLVTGDNKFTPFEGEQRTDFCSSHFIGAPVAEEVIGYNELLFYLHEDIFLNYGKGSGLQDVSLPASRFLMDDIYWTGYPLDRLRIAYIDLDNDGQEELLIGATEGVEGDLPHIIYEIFTIRDGRVYLAAFGDGEKLRLQIMSDKTIRYAYFNGIMMQESYFVLDGTELRLENTKSDAEGFYPLEFSVIPAG